jgi:hypothetical protein
MVKAKHGFPALSVRRVFIVAVAAMGVQGCGGGRSSTTPPPPPVVTVVVTSSDSSVLLGNTQQFTASVTGASNTAVNWSVNGISGGNTALGTISNTGLYTAPQDLPTPPDVTIQATSQANSAASGNAVLTIDSDISVSVAANPSVISSVFPTGNSSTACHNQQRRTPRRQGKLVS